jgi:uncharacterized protein (UPF0297 family)
VCFAGAGHVPALHDGRGVLMMAESETMMFKMEKDKENEARDILFTVYQALNEKGYNPINQLVGYILSGDPTYITNHLNARSVIRRLERDELLEEIVRFYLENKK